VTDNVANMLAAVPKHTKKIDIGLPCFDHLLNLVVRAANLANEPALDSIRDERYEDEKTNPDFKAKIPSPLTFEIIAQILPVMEKAELVSRIISADQKPTICEVISIIFE